MFKRQLIMGLLAFGLAAPAMVRADDEKGKNSIKATAKLDGEKPQPKTIPMSQDPYCLQKHPKGMTPQSDFVGADGSLAHVLVYITSGVKGKYTPPKTPITIDQNTCIYKPHVQGMVAGQPIDIVSSDPTAHNIHAKPKLNTEFNISQPTKGKTTRSGKDTFTKPEIVVEIKCDVHPWMSAYIGVFAHPFFGVTSYNSTEKKGVPAELKELPDGEYEVEAWHEAYGKSEVQKITVKGGEAKEVEFVFKKKTSK